jgi:WD40 repeat protein
MHRRFAYLSVFLFLALLTPPAARGEAPRLDRYGDPLPHGVVVRLGTERLTLVNDASDLTFSPDGGRLAAYDGEKQIRIWEVRSGKELFRIQAPSIGGVPGGLTFSPDSKALAMCYHDATVRVWDAATGKELHRFPRSAKQITSLLFSPDGRTLFAGSADQPLVFWDLAGGGKTRKIGDLPNSRLVALSRDGKTITIGSGVREGREWTFARWDTAGGKELGRHTLTLSGKWTGELSPDGGILAWPEEDGKSITLFDPLTGRQLAQAQGSDSPGNIVFSADGTVMTCRSNDGIVRVWDAATGKVRARFQAMSTKINVVALSSDGKRLALAGRADRAIHVWDVAAGRELHSFIGHRSGPLSVAFLKDGKEIVSTSRDNVFHVPNFNEGGDWSLRRWDAATGAELAVTGNNPRGEVRYASFSADGRRLATVIHDGTLHLWDVESGKEIRTWNVPTRALTTWWKDDKGRKIVHKTPYLEINDLEFSPDDKTIFAPWAKIYRWETATGRELPAFVVPGMSWISSRLPSPDGQTLLVWDLGGSRPGRAALLDASSGKVRRWLAGIPVGHGMAFSPDGRTIAAPEGEVVSLWEVASGRSRGKLAVPRGTYAVAISVDGRFLAFGGAPGSPVSLWDLATGQIVGRLREDCGFVHSLVFAPDGSRLAVAGLSSTVLICDVAALCGKKNMAEITQNITPSAKELEELWAELCVADAASAYRAIRRLALTGPRGADFLKTRLKGDKPPDARRIAQLIADLDSDQFATREKASEELQKLGIRAEPALRRTLEGKVSAEARSRINHLLEALGTSQGQRPSAHLLWLRAVEALEANGNNEARQVLAELAEEAPDSQLAGEAKASLSRLRSRQRQ